jgi:DNA-binding YbaB/EbfC family protein
MFGKLGNMMGNIQEAQRKIEETKARLDTIQVQEKSSNDKIEITITANRQIKDLKIDPSLLKDTEELSDNLILALNKAIQKAGDVNEAEMKGAAAGMMDLPGMDKLFK